MLATICERQGERAHTIISTPASSLDTYEQQAQGAQASGSANMDGSGKPCSRTRFGTKRADGLSIQGAYADDHGGPDSRSEEHLLQYSGALSE